MHTKPTHPIRIKTIALDLEGTLISNAMSQIPRPGLFSFLEECRRLVERVVMFTTVGISLSTRSAKLSGASRASAGATRVGWANARPRTVTAVRAALFENPENSPKITATSNGAQGQCERIRPAPRVLCLSTCRRIVAQIKRPLSCRIFQRFERLAKKEPATWQDCHIAGPDFCVPQEGLILGLNSWAYFFSDAALVGFEKYLKKSLSGLSTIVEPPEPKACL